MRHLLHFALWLAVGLSAGAVSAQGGAEVAAMSDGWYRQQFKEARITYLVDTISRTCFIAYGVGVASVSCRGLNRRPEWNAVISWM